MKVQLLLKRILLGLTFGSVFGVGVVFPSRSMGERLPLIVNNTERASRFVPLILQEEGQKLDAGIVSATTDRLLTIYKLFSKPGSLQFRVIRIKIFGGYAVANWESPEAWGQTLLQQDADKWVVLRSLEWSLNAQEARELGVAPDIANQLFEF